MKQLEEKGFHIIEDIFTPEEIELIVEEIESVDTTGPTFRKTKDLFAIRRFLNEVPSVQSLVFNRQLRSLLQEYMGPDYFVIKSIYFDKPEHSNWFVAYHQDLTISVDRKIEWDGFGPWTIKPQQFAVQPPLAILGNIFTVRIHLDEANEQNGALKVIPGSHLKGIYRPETIDWSIEKEEIARVKKGGVMLMRPLLLHASGRTVNNSKRRVIHIEFSNCTLPDGLQWAEKCLLPD